MTPEAGLGHLLANAAAARRERRLLSAGAALWTVNAYVGALGAWRSTALRRRRCRQSLLAAEARRSRDCCRWALAVWLALLALMREVRTDAARAGSWCETERAAEVFAAWAQRSFLRGCWRDRQRAARAHMLCVRQRQALDSLAHIATKGRALRGLAAGVLARHGAALRFMAWFAWAIFCERRRHERLRSQVAAALCANRWPKHDNATTNN